jgi:plasmid stability protein
MANLTVSIDDDLLRRARIRALEQGTSVNAVLRRYLEAFAGADTERERAVAAVLALAGARRTGSGGRRWKRDDLHD